MINVAVFYGGKSPEHDISVITALQALNNLNKRKYNIIPVYIDENNKWQVVKDAHKISSYCKKIEKHDLFCGFFDNFLYKKTKFGLKKFSSVDVCLNCCHGGDGESGALSGVFQMANLPYCCCNNLSSAICLDKIIMKDIFSNNKFSITDYAWFDKHEYIFNEQETILKVETLGYPIVVKPASTGSSIGISFCKCKEELLHAIDLAFEFDNRIIVEKAVQNLREFNQAIISYNGEKILSVIEEPAVNQMLSFKDKYIGGKMSNIKRNVNVNLPDELVEKINNTSLAAYETFLCNGVVRIDYLYDSETKELYINELNTNPGSLAFYLFKEKGINFDKMLDMLIDNAFFTHNKQNKTTYESNVLKNFNSNMQSEKLKGTKMNLT